MWWLLVSGLLSSAFVVFGCGSDRKDDKAAPSKSKKPSDKSNRTSGTKSGKSTRSKKDASGKSRSKKGHGKSGKSSKSSKSGKSGSSKKRSIKEKPSYKSQKRLSKSEVSKSDGPNPMELSTSVSAPAPLLKHPGEVAVLPDELAFRSRGGIQSFHFINETLQRQAFKVKCSDNQLYRVAPVIGILEPQQAANIDVLRQNGAAKVDKLVLVSVPIPGHVQKNAKEVLAEAKDYNLTVVPLLVDA